MDKKVVEKRGGNKNFEITKDFQAVVCTHTCMRTIEGLCKALYTMRLDSR